MLRFTPESAPANSLPRSKVTVRRAASGSPRSARAMPARTAAERRSSFGSREAKRLFLSTSEVTFALPCCLRKISRSASQCPNVSRPSTSAGLFSIQRWHGIGVLRGRRP
jgi:hypothetical protein